MVSALGLAAVIVPEPPRATLTPLNVTLELVRLELPMLLSVFVEPSIDVPEKVVIDPPKDTEVDPIVIELFVSELFPIFDRVLLAPLMVLLVRV